MAEREWKYRGLKCDVCGHEETEEARVGVCCSAFGPISCAYCMTCLRSGYEPYGIMVGGLMGVVEEGVDIRNSIREDLIPTIQANLDRTGRTWEDLQNDLLEAEAEYMAFCNEEHEEMVANGPLVAEDLSDLF